MKIIKRITNSFKTSSLPLVGLLFLMSVFFLLQGSFPFLDLPNHSTRCFIISSLLFDNVSPYASFYSFKLEFVPYILGDLIYAGLFKLLPFYSAESLWVTISFLAIPLAVWAYCRAIHLPRINTNIIVLLAAFLSTDYFFLVGFLHFKLGIALFFLSLAAWELFIKEHSNKLIFGSLFLLGIISCYLMHASALIFLALALGVIVLCRLLNKTLNLTRAVASLIPLGLVVITLLLKGITNSSNQTLMEFRSIQNKLISVASPFIRFVLVYDLAMIVIMALIIGYVLLNSKNGPKWRILDMVSLEPFFVSIAFLLAYLMLPIAAGAVHDIDVRALTYLLIFSCITCLSKDIEQKVSSNALALSLFLVGFNFIYLGRNFSILNPSVQEFNQTLNHIPSGVKLLPVETREDLGRIQPYLHLASTYALKLADTPSIYPYLFSGNRKDPQRYFTYNENYWAPDIFWYLRSETIDWERVSKEYDYIIITKPFISEKLSSLKLELVYENETASILRINK